jgi:hypothetical protein
MMLLIMKRLTQAEDMTVLHSELVELCGPHLIEIVALVLNNRHSLSNEFKVCFK